MFKRDYLELYNRDNGCYLGCENDKVCYNCIHVGEDESLDGHFRLYCSQNGEVVLDDDTCDNFCKFNT